MSQVLSEHPEVSRAIDQLSDRQRTALGLLLAGKTNTFIASELDIDRRTLWCWRQQPPFASALATEQQGLREAVQSRAIALAEKAFDALERVLQHADTDNARIAAARLVLERLDGEARMGADSKAAPTDAPTSPNRAYALSELPKLPRELTEEELTALIQARRQKHVRTG